MFVDRLLHPGARYVGAKMFVKGGSEITVVIPKDRSQPFLAKASGHWRWTFVLLEELIATGLCCLKMDVCYL